MVLKEKILVDVYSLPHHLWTDTKPEAIGKAIRKNPMETDEDCLNLSRLKMMRTKIDANTQSRDGRPLRSMMGLRTTHLLWCQRYFNQTCVGMLMKTELLLEGLRITWKKGGTCQTIQKRGKYGGR